MDLGSWLPSLGLGKYEAAFRENEIDETVLPSLTHETLKELGVAAVGHRLKLLDAIAALRTDVTTRLTKGPPPLLRAQPPRTAPSVARSRWCSRISSVSTALAARLDSEDLREVIPAYQKSVAATVQRLARRSFGLTRTTASLPSFM